MGVGVGVGGGVGVGVSVSVGVGVGLGLGLRVSSTGMGLTGQRASKHRRSQNLSHKLSTPKPATFHPHILNPEHQTLNPKP